jgi:transposase
MERHFIRPDYESTLKQPITIEEALPPNHLARWIVTLIAEWDLSSLYARYEIGGRPPYAPEMLLALILYGYCTGVVSGRAIERAITESLPFRFLAGFMHPDYSTIDRFRTECLPEIAGFLAEVLLRARREGLLNSNPTVSIDGSKIHADASKHHAVSYKYAHDLRNVLLRQTAKLLALSDELVPETMEVIAEITLRLQRLEQLNLAITVMDERADERYQKEWGEYSAKVEARKQYAQTTGRKPRGPDPKPPTPGALPKDQYNFTDPESRIMKNGNNKGVDQHYNAQSVVDQGSLLVLGCRVTNHPNDKEEALEDVDTIPAAIGTPYAAAFDTGFYSEANIVGLEDRKILPLISTGKSTHGLNWEKFFQQRENLSLPPPDATPTERVNYLLTTKKGEDIYRLRKSTVEPTFGTIKETMGFRQFSLRGLGKVYGEWCIVCLAYDLKRLHTLEVSAKKKSIQNYCFIIIKIGQLANSIFEFFFETPMSHQLG